MRLVVVALLSFVFVGGWASPARAVPLTVNSGWDLVSWECPAGASSIGTCADPGLTVFDPISFEFSLFAPGALSFTDLFVAGDEFTLTVTNTDTLAAFDVLTSPSLDGYKLLGVGLSNYDAYWDDAAFSKAFILLGAGNYQLTFTAREFARFCTDADNGPCDEPTDLDWVVGAAALRVDSPPVPEPGSIVLLGSGLAGLAAAARRRRKNP